MSKYTLLVEEAGGRQAVAKALDTASEAVDVLDNWKSGGGNAPVILRGDRTINEVELRRDAEAERTFDVR